MVVKLKDIITRLLLGDDEPPVIEENGELFLRADGLQMSVEADKVVCSMTWRGKPHQELSTSRPSGDGKFYINFTDVEVRSKLLVD